VNRNCCVLASLAVLLSESVIPNAMGQVAGSAAPTDALEEIVVTAQKREENVQRVPVTVDVVSATQLQTAGIYTAQDLGNAVPGLTMLNVGGSISPRIRGVGSTTVSSGVEAPVATYVDGVYYANSGDLLGAVSDDVSQVAVLKGPQGTLFGRNATGGVIQINTLDPGREFKVDAATSIDNYWTSRNYVFLGGPLSDVLAASVATEYTTQGKGWGRNLFNGEDVHKINDEIQVRAKLIYTPTDRTSVKLAWDYFDITGSDEGSYRYPVGYPRVFGPAVLGNPYNVDDYYQPYAFNKDFGFSLTIAHDLEFAKFTSISAYRDAERYRTFDVTNNIQGLTQYVPEYSHQLTQEVQLVSEGTSRLNWAIGAFYFHEDAGSYQVNTVYPGYTGKPVLLGQDYDAYQNTKSPSGYAQTTYSITGSTRLTIGARYTEEKKFLRGFSSTYVEPSGQILSDVPLFTTSLTNSKPTWRLSLDQDLAEDVMAYVSYNRGFKSGGYSLRSPANPPFSPETLDAYETGIKSEMLDHRVRVNTAAFFYNYKNMQLAQYTGATTVITNGGAARLYGVDVDAQAQVTEQLRFTGALEYLHSYFEDYQAPYTTYVLNPNGTAHFPEDTFTASAIGNALPYSPAWTATLGADYKITTADGLITLNVTDSYNGGFFYEADNILKQGAFHLLNTSATWQSPNGHYKVRAYVNNILNKAIASQDATAPFGFADYSNPPRIIGARFEVAF
jgi:iron complex outermembrane recepter protein